MSPVELNRAVEATLTVARSEYKYVADLETDLGELPPVTCYVNDINQVVLNIVVNAAHAIADKLAASGRRGLIRVSTRREGQDVVIAISDNGGGIPAEIRDRIFEPFFTTKEVGRGTGQGLALAWAAVKEKHSGELTFETRIGEGTTFFIRLPIAGAGAHERAGARAAT
jgi:signal transduction histidine kinase